MKIIQIPVCISSRGEVIVQIVKCGNESEVRSGSCTNGVSVLGLKRKSCNTIPGVRRILSKRHNQKSFNITLNETVATYIATNLCDLPRMFPFDQLLNDAGSHECRCNWQNRFFVLSFNTRNTSTRSLPTIDLKT